MRIVELYDVVSCYNKLLTSLFRAGINLRFFVFCLYNLSMMSIDLKLLLAHCRGKFRQTFTLDAYGIRLCGYFNRGISDKFNTKRSRDLNLQLV